MSCVDRDIIPLGRKYFVLFVLVWFLGYIGSTPGLIPASVL